MPALVTNTDTETRKAQIHFVFQKQRSVKKLKRSRQHVSTAATFSTTLFHLLSAEIKQKKSCQSGGQTATETERSVITGDFHTDSLSLSHHTLPLVPTKRRKPANNELNLPGGMKKKLAVFAVKVCAAEGAASIFFQ